MEEFILSLQALDPLTICFVVFGMALVENLFPPSPSDIVVVFAGSLVGLGTVGFVAVLGSATAGGTAGFAAMYLIGRWFGRRILDRGKLRFLPKEGIEKVERWFVRYGYWLIVANRFLAGTRAVVSFFAGMSGLDLRRTTLLSLVSSLAWNAILVSAGYALGRNWSRIGFYLTTYSQIVTGLIAIVALILLVRYARQRNNGRKGS